MDFSMIVNVGVERTQGKFAARDELEEQIIEVLQQAEPSSLEGENGGEYEVTQWEVEENVSKGALKVSGARTKKVVGPGGALSGQPVAIELVEVIRAFVRIEEGNYTDAATETLDAALRNLTERFPAVAERERVRVRKE